MSEQKYERTHNGDANSNDCCTSPPDLIGHPAEYHKSGQVSDDIDGVDEGQRDLGETQLLLIDDVERGCDRAAGE